MRAILEKIIQTPEFHGRWLSTLSYLELCGAKKIAAYMPKRMFSGLSSQEEEREILQHSAEEFRHAYFFHQQLEKVENRHLGRFSGSYVTRYLHLLDLHISRLLRNLNYKNLKRGSYLLTTFAIEKRAQTLYALYQELLKENQIPISLRSILAEEENHLFQIERQICDDAHLVSVKEEALLCEQRLYSRFLESLEREMEKEVIYGKI